MPIVKGFTIDGLNSRDLDDAIFLERTPEGFILYVSIADVASLVEKDSPFDLAAYEAGFTRYFAATNKPMLTRVLSDDKGSLLPGEERNVITVEISFNTDFTRRPVRVYKAQLTSSRKFNYEEVDSILADSSSPLHNQFMDLQALALFLLRQRQSSGALVIYDLVHGLMTNEEGHVCDVAQPLRHLAHIIIQELMIETNTSIASYLVEQNSPVLFRNHTASMYAPDRSGILRDLAQLMDHGSGRLETIRTRLFQTLNRARYEATLEGHYGLNLTAYVHFTSPIRRYSDLVNHRILSSILDGAPCPYTLEELATIGEHLNRLSDEVREGKKREFKQLAQKTVHKTIRHQGLPALLDKQFSQFIRTITGQEVCPPEVEAEILRRLEGGKLETKDLCFILLKAPLQPSWVKLKEEIICLFAAKPAETKSILMIGMQAGLIVFKSGNPLEEIGPTPWFTATVTAKRKEDIVEATASASSKKEAEQLACLQLLRKLNGLPVEETLFVPVSMPPKTPALQENYKGTLLELCKKQFWLMPEFKTEQNGPSNASIFTCTVSMTIEGRPYSAIGKAAKKTHAENAAAGELLKVIKDEIQEEPGKPVVPGPIDNPIGQLGELCIKYSLSEPVYTYKERNEGKGFKVSCQIIYYNKQPITRSTLSQNKKDGKKRAAKQVLDALLTKLEAYTTDKK